MTQKIQKIQGDLCNVSTKTETLACHNFTGSDNDQFFTKISCDNVFSFKNTHPVTITKNWDP